MPTDAEQVAAIKTNALARLAEITASPKPSYSIDGQSVSWGELHRNLMDTVRWCDEQLTGEEPVELHSQGYTL